MADQRSGEQTRSTGRPGWLSGWADWRSDLLREAHGQVLELGVRDGPNFDFYPSDVHVVATDVDAATMQGARQSFRQFRQGIALSLADAQHLPFADASFDAVVETLVFCSVPDPRAGLAEIARVLRPGGRFFSIDHVRTDQPVIGVIQDAIAPLWKAASGGCNVNRRTEETIREAGYHILERRVAMAGIMRWIVSEPPLKQPG